jgi:hypothetical protein
MTVVVVAAACSTGSGSDPEPRDSSASSIRAPAPSGFDALGIDWPRAEESVVPGAPPPAPAGFDEALLTRMAGILTDWASATTVDPDVRRSHDPVDLVAEAVPPGVAAALRKQLQGVVSPRLAVANVFAPDVTMVGSPEVTTAWKTSTESDDSGQRYVLLELQTRAAYEVRQGDGATGVIGVLRVHRLSAYPDTSDDFGVGAGWQEFGAGDCALALDDELAPQADADAAAKDLATFVEIGSSAEVQMPPLSKKDHVDADYLQRCREGST